MRQRNIRARFGCCMNEGYSTVSVTAQSTSSNFLTDRIFIRVYKQGVERYISEQERCGIFSSFVDVPFLFILGRYRVPAEAPTTNYVTYSLQVVNSEFTPKVRDVEEALAVLTPREVMWHQEQAGIIPNPCHDDPPGHSASLHDANDGPTQDWWRDFSTEASPNLYWQLYKSLAAYRMALRQEHWSGDRYDWIIRARFDVAWIRPFPKLRMFSQDAVWFGMHYW